jgi:peptide/nickel transport system ATP-binding protein
VARLLDVRNLRVDARRDDGGSVPIVKGVSLHVDRGEVVGLIGESGSGKTTIALATLAYTKTGLEFAGGEVLLDGVDVLALEPAEKRKLRGRRVAYFAQSAAATFNPALTIGEQVTEPAVLHGLMTQAEASRRATGLYRRLELPDPEGIGSRFPYQLSGGQLQRLMAAMALMGRPDLLVLDEPTTALDVTTQIEVLKVFKTVIREENAAAIYVTHDIAVVVQIADRVVVLSDGEVVEQGPVARIVGQPSHDYTRRLIDAVRPSPERVLPERRAGAPAHEAPVLEARGLVAGYGGSRTDASVVLRHVDLAVGRGRVVGVIGESGCGKSTLARVLAGLLRASAGEVRLGGRRLEPRFRDRSHDELRRIQFVVQTADTALNPKQRVADIVGRPLQVHCELRGGARRARAASLLEMVELPPEFLERYPEELSGGQKQRVNLARALAAEPEVVLCDEIISSLDKLVGANIIELLRRLRRETGVSFVFISHDLSTIASFADDVVVLYAGRVVESGPVDRVLSPPHHPYTELLIASVPELHVGWLDERIRTRAVIAGVAREVATVSTGCPFFDRCPLAMPGTCDRSFPSARPVTAGHAIACHRPLAELGA